MIHALKILPDHFKKVISGEKTFEVRLNDRAYDEGDLLALNEYDPEKGYTDRSCLVCVDYILADEQFVKKNYVIMTIKPCLVSTKMDDYWSRTDTYRVPCIQKRKRKEGEQK